MKRLRLLPAEILFSWIRQHPLCTAAGLGNFVEVDELAYANHHRQFCSSGLKLDSDRPADKRPVMCCGTELVVFPARCVTSGQVSLQKCHVNFPRPLLSSLSSASSSHSTRSLSLCGSPASASCDCGSAALHHYCPPSCSLHRASWLLHICWFYVYLCSSFASP